MRDALKNYLTLASGLTEVTRQRAEAAAKALVAQGEAAAEQVRPLAEDLLNASRANRENVANLVRTEVDKALGRMGIVTADEVARLQRRLQTVESTLRGVGATTSAFATTAARKAASRRGPGKSSRPAAKPAAKPAKSSASAGQPAATKGSSPSAAKPAAKKPAAKATAKKTGAKPAAKKTPSKSAARKPATKPAKPGSSR